MPTDSTMLFWVQSNTICMDMLDVDVVPDLRLSLYPNPAAARAQVAVALEGAAALEGCHLALFDIYGRVVLQAEPVSQCFVFQAPAVAGSYSCLLYTDKGVVALRRLVVR